MHGQFSAKSDVFSFGVLLLEIVSGQKNNFFRHGDRVEDLLSYVSKKTIQQYFFADCPNKLKQFICLGMEKLEGWYGFEFRGSSVERRSGD